MEIKLLSLYCTVAVHFHGVYQLHWYFGREVLMFGGPTQMEPKISTWHKLLPSIFNPSGHLISHTGNLLILLPPRPPLRYQSIYPGLRNFWGQPYSSFGNLNNWNSLCRLSSQRYSTSGQNPASYSYEPILQVGPRSKLLCFSPPAVLQTDQWRVQ